MKSKNADNVFILEDGELRGEGKADDLRNNDASFQRIFAGQI